MGQLKLFTSHQPRFQSCRCHLVQAVIWTGWGTCHVSSKNPGELVSQFVAILLEMEEKKYRAAVERFEYFFDQLEQLKVQEMDRLEEANFSSGRFCG